MLSCAEDPAGVSLPEIQISWEDWEHVKDLREDKYFAPQVVRPSELPFTWDPAQVGVLSRFLIRNVVDGTTTLPPDGFHPPQ